MAQFCGETNASETNGTRQLNSTTEKTAIYIVYPAGKYPFVVWFALLSGRILWAETERRRTRDARIYGGIVFSSAALRSTIVSIDVDKYTYNATSTCSPM